MGAGVKKAPTVERGEVVIPLHSVLGGAVNLNAPTTISSVFERRLAYKTAIRITHIVIVEENCRRVAARLIQPIVRVIALCSRLHVRHPRHFPQTRHHKILGRSRHLAELANALVERLRSIREGLGRGGVVERLI